MKTVKSLVKKAALKALAFATSHRVDGFVVITSYQGAHGAFGELGQFSEAAYAVDETPSAALRRLADKFEAKAKSSA